MAFNYRNAFLTNIDGVLASGTTLDLGDTQIGVFNADTYQAVTTPNFPAVKSILIAQGRDARKFPSGVGLTNETPKTQGIKGNMIVNWESKKAQLPQNMIVTLGFDGVDTTKTFAPPAGKDVNVYVTLSGQPVANLMGGSSTTHYNTLTEVFTPVFPCLNDCVDNCGDAVDCNKAVDAFIDAFNKRKIIGGEFLHKYVRVSKVVSCDTPSGLPTEECLKYTLTIVDKGDQQALGAVQAQYPGVTIKRTDRNGLYSTYEATICDESTLDPFTTESIVVPNCDECPSGATLVESATAYTAIRDGVVAASAVAGADGLVANSAVVIDSQGSSTTILFYSTSALADVQASLTDFLVAEIGTVQAICEVPGTETDWVEGDTCTKAVKTFQLSFANNPCGESVLAELQAIYGNGVTEGDTLNCVTTYTLDVTSDNASCEDCAEDSYTFTAPQPFQGTPWVDVLGDISGTGCVCGVKFESAYVQRERQECFFDAVSYEVEPLFIQISTINPNDRDYSELCEERIPVTKIQGIKYQSGLGASVLSERVKLSNFYFNRPWKTDPAERNAIAYELGIDLQGYYDEYVLTYKVVQPESSNFSGFGSTPFEQHEMHIYYPAGQGAAFVQAINAFVSSTSSLTGVTPIV